MLKAPNFTPEEAEALNQASQKLGDHFKRSPDRIEAFHYVLDALMDEKLQSLKESPLFFQLLFVAANKSTEEALELIELLTSSEENINV